jgi:DNA-binding PadR family transcriptional regulator
LRDAHHDPLARPPTPDIDPSVIGVAHELVSAPLQVYPGAFSHFPTLSDCAREGAVAERYYVLRYIAMRSNDPSLLVMTSLAEGAKHGYAITRDVYETVGVKLGPGTLYGAIARLEERGLIEPLAAEDRRRPYRLTRSGAAALREQLTVQERVATIGLRRLSTAEPA